MQVTASVCSAWDWLNSLARCTARRWGAERQFQNASVSKANGRLYAVELTMNQFVGPPIGGFLVAVGVSAAFGTAAAGYLGALLCLLTLTGSFRPVRTGPPSSIRAAARWAIQ